MSLYPAQSHKNTTFIVISLIKGWFMFQEETHNEVTVAQVVKQVSH